MTDTTQTPGWLLDRDRDRSSRRFRSRVAIACLSATVAAAAAAEAQVAHPLDELVRAGDLRRGVGVYVTDDRGRRLKGTISEVSSTKLTVTRWQDTWTLAPTDVQKIELQDPVENGIWRGFAVGAAVVYGSCFSPSHTEALCGTGSDSAAAAFVGVLIHGLPYAAIGAVVGGFLDASEHTTLYEAPGSTQLTLSPTLSPGGAGVQMSVGW